MRNWKFCSSIKQFFKWETIVRIKFFELEISQRLEATQGTRIKRRKEKKKERKKPPTPATSWLEQWTPWHCSFSGSHLPAPSTVASESHSSHSQYQRKQNGSLSPRTIISYLFWPVWWLPWRPAQKACPLFHLLGPTILFLKPIATSECICQKTFTARCHLMW